MKDIIIKKYDHYEILLFLAGVVSTFQAITFHGITVFSWFLLGLLAIGLAEKRLRRRISFGGSQEILIGLVILTMSITEIITVFLNEYPEWTGRSVKNYILILAVFGLYLVLRGDFQEEKLLKGKITGGVATVYLTENSGEIHEYGKIYFRGIIVSCIIQYITCYIEYLAYTIKGMDLSLKFLDVTTKLRDDRPVIVGLTTNPGMLVPVVLIGVCLSGKMAIRIMALVSALLINSTTCMICLAVYFALYLIVKSREIIVKGWSFNKIVIGAIAIIVIAFLFFEPLRARIADLYSYAIKRLGNTSGAIGEGLNGFSERAHFRYYWSMPYIFDNISLLRILFGFGKNCSGIPFSELYRQYVGELWIPETDPIATLYDVGIVGFAAMYALLGVLARDIWKREITSGIFMAVVLIGGIFYGFQMTWIILLELLIWNRVYD